MELTQLLYFTKVAKTENIAQTAKQLYISQATLSRTISQLEEELGVHLFEHSGNKIKINQFGKILERHAAQMFNELDAAKNEIDEISGKTQISINIAIPYSGIFGWLVMDYIAKESVYIDQRILSIFEAEEQLSSGQLDFAISFVPPSSDQFVWKSYGTAGMSVMLSKEHPLYNCESIDLRALKDDHFILNNSNTDLNTIFQTAFREADFTPKIIFGGDDPRLISSLVKDNLGVFMIPNIIIQLKALEPNPFGVRSGYRFIPLSFPRCKIKFGLCTAKGRALSKTSQEFYDFICNSLTDTLSDRFLAL